MSDPIPPDPSPTLKEVYPILEDDDDLSFYSSFGAGKWGEWGPKHLKTNTISFRKSGDLQLLLRDTNGGEIIAIVSSSAVAMASPVWHNFITPPFETAVMRKEDGNSSKASGRQICFREDNAEAMIIILHIAHLQFKKVPTALTFERLLELAVLADKYQCTELLLPWRSTWLDPWEARSKEPGHEEWLFIAWVFGQKKSFEDLARTLVREVKVDNNGEALRSTGEAFPSKMPPGIVESILKVRKSTIGELLEHPSSHISNFVKCSSPVCRSNMMQCDSMIYGSLLRGLQSVDLFPMKTSDDIQMSVNELASKLENLEIFVYSTSHYGGHHYDCNSWKYQELVDKTLSCISDPVQESHRRHMAAACGEELVEPLA